MNASERLIVALDVPTAEDALRLVDRLAGRVGLFKVGSQLFTAAGPEVVRAIVARNQKVFLDLKYHDIPNTVVLCLSPTVARLEAMAVRFSRSPLLRSIQDRRF